MADANSKEIIGKIESLQGTVLIKSADGSVRAAQLGDDILDSDELDTSSGSYKLLETLKFKPVEEEPDKSAVSENISQIKTEKIAKAEITEKTTEKSVFEDEFSQELAQALEEIENMETAAGLSEKSAGGGSFLDVERKLVQVLEKIGGRLRASQIDLTDQGFADFKAQFQDLIVGPGDRPDLIIPVAPVPTSVAAKIGSAPVIETFKEKFNEKPFMPREFIRGRMAAEGLEIDPNNVNDSSYNMIKQLRYGIEIDSSSAMNKFETAPGGDILSVTLPSEAVLYLIPNVGYVDIIGDGSSPEVFRIKNNLDQQVYTKFTNSDGTVRYEFKKTDLNILQDTAKIELAENISKLETVSNMQEVFASLKTGLGAAGNVNFLQGHINTAQDIIEAKILAFDRAENGGSIKRAELVESMKKLVNLKELFEDQSEGLRDRLNNEIDKNITEFNFEISNLSSKINATKDAIFNNKLVILNETDVDVDYSLAVDGVALDAGTIIVDAIADGARVDPSGRVAGTIGLTIDHKLAAIGTETDKVQLNLDLNVNYIDIGVGSNEINIIKIPLPAELAGISSSDWTLSQVTNTGDSKWIVVDGFLEREAVSEDDLKDKYNLAEKITLEIDRGIYTSNVTSNQLEFDINFESSDTDIGAGDTTTDDLTQQISTTVDTLTDAILIKERTDASYNLAEQSVDDLLTSLQETINLYRNNLFKDEIDNQGNWTNYNRKVDDLFAETVLKVELSDPNARVYTNDAGPTSGAIIFSNMGSGNWQLSGPELKEYYDRWAADPDDNNTNKIFFGPNEKHDSTDFTISISATLGQGTSHEKEISIIDNKTVIVDAVAEGAEDLVLGYDSDKVMGGAEFINFPLTINFIAKDADASEFFDLRIDLPNVNYAGDNVDMGYKALGWSDPALKDVAWQVGVDSSGKTYLTSTISGSVIESMNGSFSGVVNIAFNTAALDKLPATGNIGNVDIKVTSREVITGADRDFDITDNISLIATDQQDITGLPVNTLFVDEVQHGYSTVPEAESVSLNFQDVLDRSVNSGKTPTNISIILSNNTDDTKTPDIDISKIKFINAETREEITFTEDLINSGNFNLDISAFPSVPNILLVTPQHMAGTYVLEEARIDFTDPDTSVVSTDKIYTSPKTVNINAVASGMEEEGVVIDNMQLEPSGGKSYLKLDVRGNFLDNDLSEQHEIRILLPQDIDGKVLNMDWGFADKNFANGARATISADGTTIIINNIDKGFDGSLDLTFNSEVLAQISNFNPQFHVSAHVQEISDAHKVDLSGVFEYLSKIINAGTDQSLDSLNGLKKYFAQANTDIVLDVIGLADGTKVKLPEIGEIVVNHGAIVLSGDNLANLYNNWNTATEDANKSAAGSLLIYTGSQNIDTISPDVSPGMAYEDVNLLATNNKNPGINRLVLTSDYTADNARQVFWNETELTIPDFLPGMYVNEPQSLLTGYSDTGESFGIDISSFITTLGGSTNNAHVEFAIPADSGAKLYDQSGTALTIGENGNYVLTSAQLQNYLGAAPQKVYMVTKQYAHEDFKITVDGYNSGQKTNLYDDISVRVNAVAMGIDTLQTHTLTGTIDFQTVSKDLTPSDIDSTETSVLTNTASVNLSYDVHLADIMDGSQSHALIIDLRDFLPKVEGSFTASDLHSIIDKMSFQPLNIWYPQTYTAGHTNAGLYTGKIIYNIPSSATDPHVTGELAISGIDVTRVFKDFAEHDMPIKLNVLSKEGTTVTAEDFDDISDNISTIQAASFNAKPPTIIVGENQGVDAEGNLQGGEFTLDLNQALLNIEQVINAPVPAGADTTTIMTDRFAAAAITFVFQGANNVKFLEQHHIAEFAPTPLASGGFQITLTGANLEKVYTDWLGPKSSALNAEGGPLPMPPFGIKLGTNQYNDLDFSVRVDSYRDRADETTLQSGRTNYIKVNPVATTDPIVEFDTKVDYMLADPADASKGLSNKAILEIKLTDVDLKDIDGSEQHKINFVIDSDLVEGPPKVEFELAANSRWTKEIDPSGNIIISYTTAGEINADLLNNPDFAIKLIGNRYAMDTVLKSLNTSNTKPIGVFVESEEITADKYDLDLSLAVDSLNKDITRAGVDVGASAFFSNSNRYLEVTLPGVPNNSIIAIPGVPSGVALIGGKLILRGDNLANFMASNSPQTISFDTKGVVLNGSHLNPTIRTYGLSDGVTSLADTVAERGVLVQVKPIDYELDVSELLQQLKSTNGFNDSYFDNLNNYITISAAGLDNGTKVILANGAEVSVVNGEIRLSGDILRTVFNNWDSESGAAKVDAAKIIVQAQEQFADAAINAGFKIFNNRTEIYSNDYAGIYKDPLTKISHPVHKNVDFNPAAEIHEHQGEQYNLDLTQVANLLKSSVSPADITGTPTPDEIADFFMNQLDRGVTITLQGVPANSKVTVPGFPAGITVNAESQIVLTGNALISLINNVNNSNTVIINTGSEILTSQEMSADFITVETHGLGVASADGDLSQNIALENIVRTNYDLDLSAYFSNISNSGPGGAMVITLATTDDLNGKVVRLPHGYETKVVYGSASGTNTITIPTEQAQAMWDLYKRGGNVESEQARATISIDTQGTMLNDLSINGISVDGTEVSTSTGVPAPSLTLESSVYNLSLLKIMDDLHQDIHSYISENPAINTVDGYFANGAADLKINLVGLTNGTKVMVPQLGEIAIENGALNFGSGLKEFYNNWSSKTTNEDKIAAATISIRQAAYNDNDFSSQIIFTDFAGGIHPEDTQVVNVVSVATRDATMSLSLDVEFPLADADDITQGYSPNALLRLNVDQLDLKDLGENNIIEIKLSADLKNLITGLSSETSSGWVYDAVAGTVRYSGNAADIMTQFNAGADGDLSSIAFTIPRSSMLSTANANIIKDISAITSRIIATDTNGVSSISTPANASKGFDYEAPVTIYEEQGNEYTIDLSAVATHLKTNSIPHAPPAGPTNTEIETYFSDTNKSITVTLPGVPIGSVVSIPGSNQSFTVELDTAGRNPSVTLQGAGLIQLVKNSLVGAANTPAIIINTGDEILLTGELAAGAVSISASAAIISSSLSGRSGTFDGTAAATGTLASVADNNYALDLSTVLGKMAVGSLTADSVLTITEPNLVVGSVVRLPFSDASLTVIADGVIAISNTAASNNLLEQFLNFYNSGTSSAQEQRATISVASSVAPQTDAVVKYDYDGLASSGNTVTPTPQPFTSMDAAHTINLEAILNALTNDKKSFIGDYSASSAAIELNLIGIADGTKIILADTEHTVQGGVLRFSGNSLEAIYTWWHDLNNASPAKSAADLTTAATINIKQALHNDDDFSTQANFISSNPQGSVPSIIGNVQHVNVNAVATRDATMSLSSDVEFPLVVNADGVTQGYSPDALLRLNVDQLDLKDLGENNIIEIKLSANLRGLITGLSSETSNGWVYDAVAGTVRYSGNAADIMTQFNAGADGNLSSIAFTIPRSSMLSDTDANIIKNTSAITTSIIATDTNGVSSISTPANASKGFNFTAISIVENQGEEYRLDLSAVTSHLRSNLPGTVDTPAKIIEYFKSEPNRNITISVPGVADGQEIKIPGIRDEFIVQGGKVVLNGEALGNFMNYDSSSDCYATIIVTDDSLTSNNTTITADISGGSGGNVVRYGPEVGGYVSQELTFFPSSGTVSDTANLNLSSALKLIKADILTMNQELPVGTDYFSDSAAEIKIEFVGLANGSKVQIGQQEFTVSANAVTITGTALENLYTAWSNFVVKDGNTIDTAYNLQVKQQAFSAQDFSMQAMITDYAGNTTGHGYRGPVQMVTVSAVATPNVDADFEFAINYDLKDSSNPALGFKPDARVEIKLNSVDIKDLDESEIYTLEFNFPPGVTAMLPVGYEGAWDYIGSRANARGVSLTLPATELKALLESSPMVLNLSVRTQELNNVYAQNPQAFESAVTMDVTVRDIDGDVTATSSNESIKGTATSGAPAVVREYQGESYEMDISGVFAQINTRLGTDSNFKDKQLAINFSNLADGARVNIPSIGHMEVSNGKIVLNIMQLKEIYTDWSNAANAADKSKFTKLIVGPLQSELASNSLNYELSLTETGQSPYIQSKSMVRIIEAADASDEHIIDLIPTLLNIDQDKRTSHADVTEVDYFAAAKITINLAGIVPNTKVNIYGVEHTVAANGQIDITGTELKRIYDDWNHHRFGTLSESGSLDLDAITKIGIHQAQYSDNMFSTQVNYTDGAGIDHAGSEQLIAVQRVASTDTSVNYAAAITYELRDPNDPASGLSNKAILNIKISDLDLHDILDDSESHKLTITLGDKFNGLDFDIGIDSGWSKTVTGTGNDKITSLTYDFGTGYTDAVLALSRFNLIQLRVDKDQLFDKLKSQTATEALDAVIRDQISFDIDSRDISAGAVDVDASSSTQTADVSFAPAQEIVEPQQGVELFSIGQALKNINTVALGSGGTGVATIAQLDQKIYTDSSTTRPVLIIDLTGVQTGAQVSLPSGVVKTVNNNQIIITNSELRELSVKFDITKPNDLLLAINTVDIIGTADNPGTAGFSANFKLQPSLDQDSDGDKDGEQPDLSAGVGALGVVTNIKLADIKVNVDLLDGLNALHSQIGVDESPIDFFATGAGAELEMKILMPGVADGVVVPIPGITNAVSNSNGMLISQAMQNIAAQIPGVYTDIAHYISRTSSDGLKINVDGMQAGTITIGTPPSDFAATVTDGILVLRDTASAPDLTRAFNQWSSLAAPTIPMPIDMSPSPTGLLVNDGAVIISGDNLEDLYNTWVVSSDARYTPYTVPVDPGSDIAGDFFTQVQLGVAEQAPIYDGPQSYVNLNPIATGFDRARSSFVINQDLTSTAVQNRYSTDTQSISRVGGLELKVDLVFPDSAEERHNIKIKVPPGLDFTFNEETFASGTWEYNQASSHIVYIGEIPANGRLLETINLNFSTMDLAAYVARTQNNSGSDGHVVSSENVFAEAFELTVQSTDRGNVKVQKIDSGSPDLAVYSMNAVADTENLQWDNDPEVNDSRMPYYELPHKIDFSISDVLQDIETYLSSQSVTADAYFANANTKLKLSFTDTETGAITWNIASLRSTLSTAYDLYVTNLGVKRDAEISAARTVANDAIAAKEALNAGLTPQGAGHWRGTFWSGIGFSRGTWVDGPRNDQDAIDANNAAINTLRSNLETQINSIKANYNDAPNGHIPQANTYKSTFTSRIEGINPAHDATSVEITNQQLKEIYNIWKDTKGTIELKTTVDDIDFTYESSLDPSGSNQYVDAAQAGSAGFVQVSLVSTFEEILKSLQENGGLPGYSASNKFGGTIDMEKLNLILVEAAKLQFSTGGSIDFSVMFFNDNDRLINIGEGADAKSVYAAAANDAIDYVKLRSLFYDWYQKQGAGAVDKVYLVPAEPTAAGTHDTDFLFSADLMLKHDTSISNSDLSSLTTRDIYTNVPVIVTKAVSSVNVPFADVLETPDVSIDTSSIDYSGGLHADAKVRYLDYPDHMSTLFDLNINLAAIAAASATAEQNKISRIFIETKFPTGTYLSQTKIDGIGWQVVPSPRDTNKIAFVWTANSGDEPVNVALTPTIHLPTAMLVGIDSAQRGISSQLDIQVEYSSGQTDLSVVDRSTNHATIWQTVAGDGLNSVFSGLDTTAYPETGTAEKDVLYANPLDNSEKTLVGLAGDDIIFGRKDAKDLIRGDVGHDIIFGGGMKGSYDKEMTSNLIEAGDDHATQIVFNFNESSTKAKFSVFQRSDVDGSIVLSSTSVDYSLTADSAADLILAGAGKDRIYGAADGTRIDLVTGGGRADDIDYLTYRMEDVGVGSADAATYDGTNMFDIVTGFEANKDKIDLVQIFDEMDKKEGRTTTESERLAMVKLVEAHGSGDMSAVENAESTAIAIDDGRGGTYNTLILNNVGFRDFNLANNLIVSKTEDDYQSGDYLG